MSLLAVHDLTVARGGMRTVESVTFTLDAGQALILRGPNGIGKTTLLRTVAGLQPPVTGRIEAAPDAIAYAAHADGLKTALTVTENTADLGGITLAHAALRRYAAKNRLPAWRRRTGGRARAPPGRRAM